jgi:hypothetical protein
MQEVKLQQRTSVNLQTRTTQDVRESGMYVIALEIHYSKISRLN